jgi:phosphohistidine phosphatase
MKRLYLIRHAAAGASADGSDLHRPLSREGLDQARRAASALAGLDVRPDLLVTSPADRAHETARIFSEAFGFGADRLVVEDRVYDANDVLDLLEVVRSLPAPKRTALLFGHNPVISEFAMYLVPGYSAMLARAGLVGIELDVETWKEAGLGKGRVLDGRKTD